MACDRCSALTDRIDIASTDTLTNALRRARAKVADGTLIELPAESAEAAGSMAALPETGPRPEAIRLRLRCADCGTRFALDATTTGETAGSWSAEP